MMSTLSSSFPPNRCFTHFRRLRSAAAGPSSSASTSTSSSKLSAAVASATSAGWGRRRPSTAPDCPPATATEIRALADFIAASERLLVITGAGVSTESSIPDYRSKNGAYSTGFKPMTHQDFMRNDANRRRYWARSFVGWKRFAEQTAPNPAHEALAALQREGYIARLITQNVDRLHHAAGAVDVLELHGTTHEVVCMSCGAVTPRRAMQRQMAGLNPGLASAADHAVDAASAGIAPYDDGVTPISSSSLDASSFASSSSSGSSSAAMPPAPVPAPKQQPNQQLRTRPDGDVELNGEAVVDFVVPPCAACPAGGPLKPAVVFFGDSVPAPVALAARAASHAADAVLIVGQGGAEQNRSEHTSRR